MAEKDLIKIGDTVLMEIMSNTNSLSVGMCKGVVTQVDNNSFAIDDLWFHIDSKQSYVGNVKWLKKI